MEEDVSKSLYVGNIQWDSTERELEELFAPFGKIISAQIIKDHNSGKSKGFGFIEMENPDEADEAMQNLHGKELRGRTLKINEARERRSRRTYA